MQGRVLSKLAGVIDPERKEKLLEETFIEVFDKEAKTSKVLNF